MASISKMAPAIAIVLIVIVVIVVLVGEQGDDKGQLPQAAMGDGAGAGVAAPGPAAAPFKPQQSPVSPQAQEKSSAAPMLDNLVSGLEEKVKADPGNLNNKLLLAQTYAELDRMDQAIALVRELPQDTGGDTRITLVSAMVLGKSDNPEHLKEALALLSQLEAGEPARKGQVLLHKGKVQAKMGDNDGAKTTFQQGLDQLAPTDPIRQEIEKELAKL